MLAIHLLSIDHFRNLIQASIHPSPFFNLITGPNGSGKTSLLEAIYYLGHNRSFRTHAQNNLMTFNAPSFCLHAQVKRGDDTVSLGIERQLSGKKYLRINQENTYTASDLAEHLPLQLIDAYSHQYFINGPKLRRDFINWGMFHMKHNFLNVWKSFNKSLEQRNAILKQKSPDEHAVFWNQEFIRHAEKIDEMRQEYLNQFKPIVNRCLQELLDIQPIELFYHRGWKDNKSLSEELLAAEYSEMKCGYTLYGPQRADLQLLYQNKPIQETFSHGQLKLAAYALKIAQSQLLIQEKKKTPIFLIDDLPSELDENNQIKILTLLQEMKTQVFISAIDDHVKKGPLVSCLEASTACFTLNEGEVKEGTMGFIQ